MISKDDFAAWKDNPITQAVLTWVSDHARAAKVVWEVSSWDRGVADPVLLAELRARAQVADDFASVELSDIQEESDEQKHVGPRAA